MIFEKGSN